MTALEEIKKALKKVYIAEWYISGVKTNGLSVVHNAADSSMFGITAETFEAEYLVAVNPAAISELISTLESLQRENEELRQRLDVGPCGEDAIDVAESAADHLLHRAEAAEAEVKRLRENQLTWRPMGSAPKDGKHCILSIPSGGFAYTVQGAFMGGKWINALNVDAEPLAWMPNVMLPDAYCPWKRPFSVPLASTKGDPLKAFDSLVEGPSFTEIASTGGDHNAE
ncbi:hypothetical protein FHW77_002924 [Agrobacterium sp. RC10-4-1]|uniref:cell division protein ZapB n=1 Tax=Agrobacterium sp. RC10-4-1 TaxID=2587039 RepID=UPI0015F9D068|nr:cell division protein ZapB [Agrobacterium sp. RC10-4-1]MBA8799205.1 hypothetical protein [Agrobacterium sp. RC10-4-1]